MGNEIRSRLWKSSLLADSRVFVRLVKAACAAQQIPYSDDVLLAVSTNRQIVDAVGITKNGNADDVLAELALSSGTLMDKHLMRTVGDFRPPVQLVAETAVVVVTLDVLPA